MLLRLRLLARPTRPGLGRAPQSRGLTVLETLVAVLLIVLVVIFTGRTAVTTLSLIGRGKADDEHGARARSQAITWIRATSEFARKVGFDSLVAACATGCKIPPGDPPVGATSPFDKGPALPEGFQCGRVLLSTWSSPLPSPPPSPTALRGITIEVYRGGTGCADIGPDPFLTGHTAMAARQ